MHPPSVESFGYLSPSYKFPSSNVPNESGAVFGANVGPTFSFPAKRSVSASDVAARPDDIASSDASFYGTKSCAQLHQTVFAQKSALALPVFQQTHYSPNRKSSSFVAIAPQPSTMIMLNGTPISQPTPFRRSSLLSYASNSNSLNEPSKDGTTNTLIVPLNSSLTAYSPPLEDFSSESPVCSSVPVEHGQSEKPSESFEDPLMLLHWLTQVDLSRYGIARAQAKASPKKASIPLTTFHIPAVEQFKRIEGEFMEAVRRRSQQHIHKSQHQSHRVPTSSPDLFAQQRSPSVPSTPVSKKRSVTSSPKSPSTPRVPYKGRFGLNPTCGSCKTSSTPYWRDSWSNLFILCNACGLRYAKFKRYCNTCSYVPRKEDKNASCCTQCSSAWSYKS